MRAAAREARQPRVRGAAEFGIWLTGRPSSSTHPTLRRAGRTAAGRPRGLGYWIKAVKRRPRQDDALGEMALR